MIGVGVNAHMPDFSSIKMRAAVYFVVNDDFAAHASAQGQADKILCAFTSPPAFLAPSCQVGVVVYEDGYFERFLKLLFYLRAFPADEIGRISQDDASFSINAARTGQAEADNGVIRY